MISQEEMESLVFGDKVVIEDLFNEKFLNQGRFVHQMMEFSGKELTVFCIEESTMFKGEKYAVVEEDGNRWCWYCELIKEIKKDQNTIKIGKKEEELWQDLIFG